MIKLEEGETVLHVARKHWFIFVAEVASMAFFAFVPALVVFVPASIFAELEAALQLSIKFAPLLLFFWGIWLLILWMVFAMLWTNYYLDVWLITNHRVIDIEQAGLFHRSISSFRFDQIQDATVKVSGLIATLIGFGTVEIRTASNESFVFKGVAAPKELKEKILAEHHRVHTREVGLSESS